MLKYHHYRHHHHHHHHHIFVFKRRKICKLCTRGYRKRLLEPGSGISWSAYFYIHLLSFSIVEQIKQWWQWWWKYAKRVFIGESTSDAVGVLRRLRRSPRLFVRSHQACLHYNASGETRQKVWGSILPSPQCQQNARAVSPKTYNEVDYT